MGRGIPDRPFFAIVEALDELDVDHHFEIESAMRMHYQRRYIVEAFERLKKHGVDIEAFARFVGVAQLHELWGADAWARYLEELGLLALRNGEYVTPATEKELVAWR